MTTTTWLSQLASCSLIVACACPPPTVPSVANPPKESTANETRAIEQTLDAWHEAASQAQEEAYFSHFTPDAIFMGTDATERWSVSAFRAYAHPHFAKGKAWSFRATERHTIIGPNQDIAWFDEALATPNLGPARGSGVLRKSKEGQWKLAHYNLTVTIPNERFKEVRKLLSSPAPAEKHETDQSSED